MAERVGYVLPGRIHADCKKIGGLQPWVTARIDARKRAEVHVHIQRHAVVGEMATDFDAQGGDFGQTLKVGCFG